MTDLTQALDTIIKAKIAEALAGGEGKSLIDAIVDSAMNGTVEVGNGYSKKQVPFLKHHVTEAIQRHTVKAVNEVLNERADDVKAAVKAHADEAIDKMASSMIDRLASMDDWRVNLHVNVGYNDED